MTLRSPRKALLLLSSLLLLYISQPLVTAQAPPDAGYSLEARLSSLVNGGVAAGSESSIQVMEMASGRVVAQRNADQPVIPASNMKLFTTAAAYDLLGPSFEFKTVLSIRGSVDSTGVLNGDVKITGGGDPSIGGRFHDGQSTAVIRNFAEDLKRAGIRTITGDVILEHGYFDTEYVHPTWPEDQLVNWYEAPVAALSIQEGCVMVRVRPGSAGGPAIVEMEPPNRYMRIVNTATTGGGRGAFIGRKPGTNDIIVRGQVPARSGATEVFVTVMNPLHFFANVTHDTLQNSGVRINGTVRLAETAPHSDWRVVSRHQTPLAPVTYVINKVSQNHYAEQLLKTLGAEVKGNGSWPVGSAVIAEWMQSKVGVPPSQFQMIDGSGMSRFNRASASSFVRVLDYMWDTPHRRDFVSSMPYSGERDSRLRRRLNTEPYARQVYAKTGYLSGAIGLSGYVHAKSGKVYAFSFLFNRYKTGVWGVYNLQDDILKTIIDHG